MLSVIESIQCSVRTSRYLTAEAASLIALFTRDNLAADASTYITRQHSIGPCSNIVHPYLSANDLSSMMMSSGKGYNCSPLMSHSSERFFPFSFSLLYRFFCKSVMTSKI
jgi:hypothetical protein